MSNHLQTPSQMCSSQNTLTAVSSTDEHLLQLFRECDTDRSGSLCKTELRDLCSKFGIASSDADAIFNDLDADGDGMISFEDFKSGFDDYEKGILTSASPPSSGYDYIKKGLERIDSNNMQQSNDVKKDQNSLKNSRKSVLKNSKTINQSVEIGIEAQSVIQELLESVRNLQEENQKLANSWIRDKKEHERHMHQLEEDVDSHVKEVEVRVKQIAKEEVEAERKSLRELMKGEMEELQTHLSMFEKVDSWLKTNQVNNNDDRMSEVRTKLEDSHQENRHLRLSLLDTQTHLALMRSELSQIRNLFDEKCKELSSEKERIAEAQHEQDNLSRQLFLLHDANKRLQDTNDTLRTVIDVAQSPSPTNPLKSLREYDVQIQNKLKRGSVIGDYIRQNSVQSCGRLSEMDIESISTIDDEVMSLSKQSFASCPATVSTVPLHYRNLNFHEEIDSGLSSTVRDEFDFLSPQSNYMQISESRSLQTSPYLRQNSDLSMKKSSSANCVTSCAPKQSVAPIVSTIDSFGAERIHIGDANGPPERTYKIIFIGDASVGKSTYILRVTKGMFMPQLSTTLGIDFQVRTFSIENRNVALQLWDTAGQERYRSITKSYFRKADGIMLLYDVTSEASFLSVREWINAVEEVTSKGVPVAIVGNKIDIRSCLQAQDHRCIKTEEGYQLSQQYGVIFSEVSCKDGTNVIETIGRLTHIMTENEDQFIKNAGIELNQNSKSKKLFNCCSIK